ncbi:hypothetical protein [Enterocloster clostridioformis]|uniref:hypothetical protein n=1 Tax=Enterocloster clostridioformis TaxID=1531 RepID=UPI0004079B04|nr:hypothetical protein [Enterocloster clostridioformis]
MNTAFKILWFEDEVSWFRMERIRIEAILKNHYLIPDISRKDGDEFDVIELTGNDYDLILMDYKLAAGKTGDTIVSAIRENDILTDILFYSSEEQNMLSALSKRMPSIDGVYLTKRDYTIFTEKAEKLISKIVKRSEDVVNLRGFVLDNTSNFELRIKEILNICWQKFNDEQRDSLTETTIALLNSKKSWATKQVETAKTKDNVFTYANNVEYLLSVADRLDIIQAVLPILFSNYNLPDSLCPSDFKRYYIDKINVYRNKLGHIKFGEKLIRIKEKDVEINQDLHRFLRKNIAEVEGTINNLETYITQNM